MMSLDLESLNPNQRRAVESEGGAVLVLAGPGSGKTRVLATRIARALESSRGQRFRVLGLTFTTKAAAEMRQRVTHAIPFEEQDRVLLTTFHSFCGEVLRQHGCHLGIDPGYTVLTTDAARLVVMRVVLNRLAGEGVEVSQSDSGVLAVLDRLANHVVPVAEISSAFSSVEVGEAFGRIAHAYRAELLARNELDFPALITLTHELLTTHPPVLSQVRLVYQRVCVDEFQDTNLAQYEILRQLVGPNPERLFVVADDDQVLYQWNSASPERLADLVRDFGATTVQLPTNYRCPPEVVALANNLIRNNSSRAPGKEPLVANREACGSGIVRCRSFADFEHELAWVAADLASHPPSEWGECVVLGRNNKVVQEAVDQINVHGAAIGMRAVRVARRDEFSSAPVRWLQAVLRLAASPSDARLLSPVCEWFARLSGIDIGPDAVTTAQGGSLLAAWMDTVSGAPKLDPAASRFLSASRDFATDHSRYTGFVRRAFDWLDGTSSGQAEYLEDRAAWLNINREIVDRLGSEDLELSVFLQEIDLSSKSAPPPPGAVRCMTTHGAKGLEFGHVYLIALMEDVLPSFQSVKAGDDSAEMQEERRNCFVAITRSQRTLTLTYSSSQGGWARKPSRFLDEMSATRETVQ